MLVIYYASYIKRDTSPDRKAPNSPESFSFFFIFYFFVVFFHLRKQEKGKRNLQRQRERAAGS